MSALWRWLKRILTTLVVGLVALTLPPIYIEIACQGPMVQTDGPAPLVDEEWQRAESRTLLTYPEWHIVHAYDDYAAVIATGDPHDFAYSRAIAGFWQTLCPLTRAAASMGGVDGDTKATIYTIGVSFTAELLAKAAYEETIGRLATLLRGNERTPLDNLSARQSADYARFLQQKPWYKWDFAADAAALNAAEARSLRDTERRLALGLEYSAKSAYAAVIEAAVAGVGADQLRLRSVVQNVSEDTLSDIEGIEIIRELGGGIEIETSRYRAFTGILAQLTDAGADLIEIAGNDEILFTGISDTPTADGALFSFPRQGHSDYRHLVLVPVGDLADRLRGLNDVRLEHVHDY